MNPLNNTTSTFPQNFTPSPKVADPQENQDAKIGGTAKKVFIVLGIILVGAVVTTAVTITLIPFGPTAVTASIVTGVALTILAVVLAIYFLTGSNVPTQEQDTPLCDDPIAANLRFHDYRDYRDPLYYRDSRGYRDPRYYRDFLENRDRDYPGAWW